MTDATSPAGSPETRDVRLLKHVNAVALMPTKDGGRITAVERRLFNVLLHRAQDDGDQQEYCARLHEIKKLAEFNSNNSAELKKALKRMMGTVVEWQSPTSGEMEDWEASTLLSGASIKKDKATGAVWLRWRYDNKIQAQLLTPDRYARLLLSASVQLRTHPAMALYEICARYVDNPGHRTARQHWRWWRPVLGGIAYEENSGEYRYWKRDVLNPAIAEINANTELEVAGPIEYKERDNKTIAEIQFDVRLKGRAAPRLGASREEPEDIDPANLEVIGRAIQRGLSQSEAAGLLREFGRESLDTGLVELGKRLSMPSDKVGTVGNAAGWLRAALRNKAAAVSVPERQSSPNGKPAKDLERSKAALTEEWLRRKKDQLRSLFLELPSGEQAELLADFRASLTLAPLIKRFDASGWEHRMIRDSFATFLGDRWEGATWSKPAGDEILQLALEKQAGA